MKINNGQIPEGQDVYLRTEKVQKQDAQERDAGVERTDGKDRINLSEMSRDLKKIREGIEQIPETRVEKVGRLKEAIANGTYTIDPVKIAEKMLDEI